MIIVDYYCPACDFTVEAFSVTPVPECRSCDRCGMQSRRRFSTAGLSGRASRPASGSTACVDNPDVPGLCHVGSAANDH